MGYPIVLHYNTSTADALQAKEEISAAGGQVMLYQADLRETTDYSLCFQRCASDLGVPVTCLINNASVYQHDDISNFDPKVFSDAMAVNVRAPLCLISSFAQQLPQQHRGVVVNILDQKLANPNADHLSYTLSKFALFGATESLSRSLAASSIRVNAVSPGFTLAHSGITEEELQAAQRRTPLGYGPCTADIVSAVCYLVGAEAVTGQVLQVDAGERFNQRLKDI